LTVTPTDLIDHSTFSLFNFDDGLETFAYTFEEAVSNVPPYPYILQVMKIHTKFHDERISKPKNLYGYFIGIDFLITADLTNKLPEN
jgi:type I site-specific restriction endonuclease